MTRVTYAPDHENDSPGGEVVLIERDDRRWWPLAVCLAGSLLTGLLAVLINQQTQHRQEQQTRQIIEQQRIVLCTMIVASDDNYRALPPTSDLGKAQARSYASLRVSQGCPPPAN